MTSEQHHKTKIKWPVLLVQNTVTGNVTAKLKGVEGVIAQGRNQEEALKELSVSLIAMAPYLDDNDEDDAQESVNDLGEGITTTEGELEFEVG